MDHLLVVPLKPGIPQSFLESLHQAGWRVTVSPDLVRTKQLLQKGGISGIMMEFSPADHDPDRMKILRYVYEFCPGILVVMMHAGAETLNLAGSRVVKTFNTVEDERVNAEPHPALDLYYLSPAQKRIAQLVAQAYPNREIARKLKIKEQSVRNEISRIFKKMGVWNRVELALLMRDGPKQPLATPSPENGGTKRPWEAEFSSSSEEPTPRSVSSPAIFSTAPSRDPIRMP